MGPLVKRWLPVLIVVLLIMYRDQVRAFLGWLRDWLLGPRDSARPAQVGARPTESASDRRQRERNAAHRRAILSLSVDEARVRAERELSESATWECDASDDNRFPHMLDLGPSARSLFARWSRVEDRFGGVRLSRTEVAPYTGRDWTGLSFGSESAGRQPSDLKIGIDADGDPVIVRDGGDTVCVVHGGRSASRDTWLSEYPSVYHFLLLEHGASRPR